MLTEFEAVFIKIDSAYSAKKIPKIKTIMRGAISNILNLSNLLVRKSLLKENLYNYTDSAENDFYLPEEKLFGDDERPRVMYDRLKALMEALEFQANNLASDLDSITNKYLENCYKITTFFSFHTMSSPNVGINTRTLKEMTDRILAGKDQILRRFVQDNLKILADNFNKMKLILDDFARYKKEKYKALIRFKVFPFLKEDYSERIFQENPSTYLKKLKRFMALNTPDIQFNKYWLPEAIKSCYSQNENEALEKIKNSFLTDVQQKTVRSSIHTPREKLLGIIGQFSNSGNILEKLYIRIEQNMKFLHSRKRNFIEQMLEVFKKALNTTYEDDFFQLEYINPFNKEIQKDTININDFMTTIKKKVVVYKSLSNPSSSSYDKVKRGTEDALYKFIEDNYFDLLLTKERVMGINGEIRLRVPKKIRIELREIREPIEKLDDLLKHIGDMRRKYVTEQSLFIEKYKRK